MLMCPALMSCSDESLSDETPETTKAPKETKEETTDTEPQIETVTPSEAVGVLFLIIPTPTYGTQYSWAY